MLTPNLPAPGTKYHHHSALTPGAQRLIENEGVRRDDSPEVRERKKKANIARYEEKRSAVTVAQVERQAQTDAENRHLAYLRHKIDSAYERMETPEPTTPAETPETPTPPPATATRQRRLGTIGNNVATSSNTPSKMTLVRENAPDVLREVFDSLPSRAQDRALAFEQRQVSARWLCSEDPDAPRPRRSKCGWAILSQGTNLYSAFGDGYGVSLRRSDPSRSSSAHFGNVETCKSVWACPCCSAPRRMAYAQRIQELAEPIFSGDKGGVFLTLTLRHSLDMPLKSTLEALNSSYRALINHRAWKGKGGIKARYGVENYLRVVEITYSFANGWHPHIHALLSTSDLLSEEAVSALRAEIYGLWAGFVFDRLGTLPSESYGVDARRVDGSGKVLAQYMGKVAGFADTPSKKEVSWGVDFEMTRFDLKKARKESRTPFELLDSTFPAPESVRRKLWLEYVNATHGRRFITASRGWKISESEVEALLESVVEGDNPADLEPTDVETLSELVVESEEVPDNRHDVLCYINPLVYSDLKRTSPAVLGLIRHFASVDTDKQREILTEAHDFYAEAQREYPTLNHEEREALSQRVAKLSNLLTLPDPRKVEVADPLLTFLDSIEPEAPFVPYSNGRWYHLGLQHPSHPQHADYRAFIEQKVA